MNLGGYTNIPETLAEAQAEIVRLMDEQKQEVAQAGRNERALKTATAMIEDARAALNAIEAPSGSDVRHPVK